MPDQLLIGGIRQDEAMFGALKQRRETRRLEEHLLESTNLHVSLPAATNFLDPTVQPEWGLVRRLKLPIPQASATSKR